MKNIFFETNQYELIETSRIELNKLVAMLQKYPDIKIEIGGHTDNVGSHEYNISLSQNRAKSVRDYLIENKIDPARIKYKGYGETQPVDSNDTEEGKANNRRTEFKIIE
jgi:outer membrane protein OmpA-like peptidoglycan-associated protein